MVYGLPNDEIREVVQRVIETRNKEKSRERLLEYTVRNIKLRGEPFPSSTTNTCVIFTPKLRRAPFL